MNIKVRKMGLKNRRVAKQGGFTLVELLVVLAILGMLAALVGPQVLNQLGGAKSKSAAIQIRDFEQALELYKLVVGRFPQESDGLDALVRKPSNAKDGMVLTLKKMKFLRILGAMLTSIRSQALTSKLPH